MGVTGGRNYKVNVEDLKEELERLAQENLDNATFAEKRDFISKLGIRVYPSEDSKTMKVRCSLNFGEDGNCQSSDRCVIIEFGSPRSR